MQTEQIAIRHIKRIIAARIRSIWIIDPVDHIFPILKKSQFSTLHAITTQGVFRKLAEAVEAFQT